MISIIIVAASLLLIAIIFINIHITNWYKKEFGEEYFMVMMDDERNKKNYNEIREKCLMRSTEFDDSDRNNFDKDKRYRCDLGPGDFYICLPDDWKTCPLFVFVKEFTKEDYGR